MLEVGAVRPEPECTVFELTLGGPPRIDTRILPAATRLRGNAPNPFNPSTTIAFDLRRPGPVEVAVADVHREPGGAREAADPPVLVEELIPGTISLGVLQKMLRHLLRERVPVRDLLTILEAAGERGRDQAEDAGQNAATAPAAISRADQRRRAAELRAQLAPLKREVDKAERALEAAQALPVQGADFRSLLRLSR